MIRNARKGPGCSLRRAAEELSSGVLEIQSHTIFFQLRHRHSERMSV